MKEAAILPPHRPAERTGVPQILLAEDDRAAAEMLTILLTNVGYEVRVASSGAEAIRRVAEEAIPDLVLLDWMLPEMTGLAVCRQIRGRWDPLRLPILMVTARADMESKAAAFAAGANDYITKPFFGAELRARVAAHLRLKELSEERRALDEHLMEREKLATLGLLVSGVAHDLNNPLAAIHGYAQLLLEEESDPEKRVALDRINQDVRRCNRIVADLLRFARRHAPVREEVVLNDLLVRTLDLRERQLRNLGVEVQLEVPRDLPTLVADEHQLEQVFMNILVNAEHALRETGGTLRITAGPVFHAGSGASTGVAIRFFNDGPPIGADVLDRIFEPFFTTKGAEEGTGLGLAVCRRIVQDHGGTIEVTSGREGTVFTVLLPGSRDSGPEAPLMSPSLSL